MKYSSIKAFICRDGHGYIAECHEVDVTVRGTTLDETVDRLRHGIADHLRGADMARLGLVEEPMLFITFEDVPIPKGRKKAAAAAAHVRDEYFS